MAHCFFSDETDLETLWKKTIKAWTEGTVIATVGTDSLTPAEEKEFGLVGDHNYSIFDMIDRLSPSSQHQQSRRLIKIRNPWSRGGVPRNSFSTAELRDALPDLANNDHTTGNTGSRDRGEMLSPGDPLLGTFWIDYPTLTQSFKTLYLNWNPSLFPHIAQKHFSFTPNGSDFDVAGNGQFMFSTDGTGEVWVLIERHCLGKLEGWEGYIGLAVFKGEERVYSYSRAIYRVSSLHISVSRDVSLPRRACIHSLHQTQLI